MSINENKPIEILGRLVADADTTVPARRGLTPNHNETVLSER